jgi:hypothetical protein
MQAKFYVEKFGIKVILRTLKDVFPIILEQTGNPTIDKELVKKFRENLQNKRHRVV